ncbi:MAG TPA: ABC transporter permease [Streptosporangiaceae bacterium]|jgi:NitT/TauT family transport system permease protein|nr:ABC transporter permease [Streptosporangiaceae bacterium]
MSAVAAGTDDLGGRADSVTVVRPRRKPLAERRLTGIVAPLVAVAVVLGAWQITSLFFNPVLISSPSQVASAFVGQFRAGTATSALGVSLRDLYVGLAIGLTAGVLVGLCIGRYRFLDAFFSPFINAANATPLNVLIPLLIVWVGISTEARVLFVVLISFFPVALNTAGGLRNVGKGYVEVGRMMGLGEHQLMRKVILPAAAPYIFAGIRVGVALGVIGMIVGEMEVSNVGLGYLLNFYGNGFETSKLLALVVLAALIGVANVLVVRAVQARWFRWISAAR